MPEPIAALHENPGPTVMPTLSPGSARLRAVGLWALSTVATLIVPSVMTAAVMQEDGLVSLLGFLFFIALVLIAPFVGIAWALQVVFCAFVAGRRHRAGARASVVLDAIIGAFTSFAIWTTCGILAAIAFDAGRPTMPDRTPLLIAVGVTTWLLLLGAFNGGCLGAIARRRAGG